VNWPALSGGMRLQQVGRRIGWHARLCWERLAWPQFLAVAVIGFGVGLGLWVNEPLRREVRELQAVIPTVAPQHRPTPPGSIATSTQVPVARDSAAYVSGLIAFLPTQDVREQQLRILHGLATASGVDLSRVEYAQGSLEHLSAQRMSMQLTVSAEYFDYRKYLHTLLVALPNLVIDRVTMEKAPGQATRLNVRLETSLYYRDPSAPTTGAGQ